MVKIIKVWCLLFIIPLINHKAGIRSLASLEDAKKEFQITAETWMAMDTLKVRREIMRYKTDSARNKTKN